MHEPDLQRPAVVALGASAGGLDALKAFFAAMPARRDIAFVVVTHLPAQRESLLAKLLGRASSMPTKSAADGEAIRGGQIYVLPPGHEVEARHGRLALSPSHKVQGASLPIDRFMRSLADDAGEHAIGIVLSGTDHDGTVGLKEIKAVGGLTIVQSPSSAQFPEMPSSALAASVPDLVLAPDEMPHAIVRFIDAARSRSRDTSPEATAGGREERGDGASGIGGDSLVAVLALIAERSDHDFRAYRPAMLGRRLRRRMAMRGLLDVQPYLDVLRSDPHELDALIGDFLIGITEFFRDTEAWEALEERTIPRIVERHADQSTIRVWCAGCSTGEEAYSIAMQFCDALGPRTAMNAGGLSVFATDVDASALRFARAGRYPQRIEAVVSPERLARYFTRDGAEYVVKDALRESILFGSHNLLRNTPFSRLDLIVCRNVLIYLDPALQEKVIELFHFALSPGGFLFLGRSESLGAHRDLFAPVAARERIFQSVGAQRRLPAWSPGNLHRLTPIVAPPPADNAGRRPGTTLHDYLAVKPARAAVLVNRDLRPLYFEGETERYLHLAGEPRWDLLELVRDELRMRLRSALRSATADGTTAVFSSAVHIQGEVRPVSVRVEPVGELKSAGQFIVTFDEPAPAQSSAPAAVSEAAAAVSASPDAGAIARLESELTQSRALLADALTEAEHRYAEMRSAHEEAAASTEQLQASTEELQSAQEELQSINEELRMSNSELESKLAELAKSNDDMANLLASSHVATLFLDRALCIARFTPAVTALFPLVPADVGRPLRDFTGQLVDPALFDDARAVLERGVTSERELPAPGDRWFLRRLQPYLKGEGDHEIAGVVVSWVDVTRARQASRQSEYLAKVLSDSNDAVFVHDLEGRITFWNHAAEKAYGYAFDPGTALRYADLVPEDDRGRIDRLVATALAEGGAGPEQGRRVDRQGRVTTVLTTLSSLRDAQGACYAVLHTERDLTEKLAIEREITFRRMADAIPAFIRIEDAAGRAQYVNQAYQAYIGQPGEALLGEGWLQFAHPDDLAVASEQRRKAVEAHERSEMDLRLRRFDGTYRWVRSVSTPRYDEAGQFVGFVCLATDVQDRKQLEESLHLADRAKDNFLAMLAHELRGPLAPIRSAAELIRLTGAAEPRTLAAGEVIVRQTDHLAHLLDDLLDIARITRGMVVIDRLPVELAVVIESALERTRPLAQQRQQTLTVGEAGAGVFVEGDVVRLTQVVGNLLNNAVKYTPPGGTISVEVAATTQTVEIRVCDTGVGIAPDALQSVFDPFAQGENARVMEQGGLGLGLAIVRHLVELHGGSVEGHSAGAGQGSELVVRLPRLDQPAPAPQPNARPPASGAGLSRRILLVDDNEDGARMLAIVLELAGHTVLVRTSAAAALADAAEFRPELCVLDIGMPVMNGYELARRLRSVTSTAGAKLVALTGYGQEGDIARAREAGFDRHLVKPVDPCRLTQVIEELLPGV